MGGGKIVTVFYSFLSFVTFFAVHSYNSATSRENTSMSPRLHSPASLAGSAPFPDDLVPVAGPSQKLGDEELLVRDATHDLLGRVRCARNRCGR